MPGTETWEVLVHTEAFARPRPSSTALVILALVGGVAGAAVLLAATVPSVSGWLSTATGVLGGLCGLYAAIRTTGRMRVAWIMLSLLVLMFAGGDVLWMVYANATGTVPLLSLADALYLLALIPATIGLVVYPILRGVSGRMRPVAMDALVLVLATTFHFTLPGTRMSDSADDTGDAGGLDAAVPVPA